MVVALVAASDEGIWDLRDSLTSYNAAYVALAEALQVSLVTADRHLARSSGHRVRIEVLGR